MILFMKGTGTVVVNVDNENDHAPFCVQSTGIFSVSENAGMNNRLYDFVISHCNVFLNQSLAQTFNLNKNYVLTLSKHSIIVDII